MFPVSFTQERLWFLEQLEPGKSVHNIYEAIRFSGPLQVEALERSINEIVRRHAALRTVFVEVADRVAQVVVPSLYIPVSGRDLRSLGETEREPEARLRATNEVRQLFDLRHGPLIRSLLIRLRDEEHVLVVTMHRIICDGVSMAVFLRELQELYNADSERRSALLTGLPTQYGEYAAGQRDRLQGRVLEQQLAYWTQQLNGGPPAIELPADRPRPSVQSYRGAKQSLALPALLKEQLRLLSVAQGVTLDVTLLAGFQTLLFRYCHQRDFAIGVPNAGRSAPETVNLIGPCADTLVLRTELSPESTFPQLLRRTQDSVEGAHSHHDLPFGILVQALGTDRNLAYAPLFQVQFAFQEADPPVLDLTGLTVAPFEIAAVTSMFDLSLLVCEQRDGLRATLEYSTDLFDSSTIQRMLLHFRNLLEHAVRDTGESISQWPLLTPAERHQMLVAWNNTGGDYPRDQTISHLVERQASVTPDAIAVSFDRRALTYRELNNRANQLARYLRDRGVGPEILVGICVERSLEMIVGLLAILKAGGAYVPLDPMYPQERLAWMIEDSHAPVLLTQEPLVKMFAGYGGTVVCLDREWPQIRHEKTTDVPGVATAENRAYVIYTSGSMGWPKGVQISQRNVINLVNSMRGKIGMTARDVLLGVTTISFDIHTLDIWMPLLSGARLVVARGGAGADGLGLATEIGRSGATVLEATPSTWRLLLESGWQGSPQLTAVCGGEALSRELASQLQDRVKTLWNAYGPTETTTWSAAHAVSPTDNEVLIGRPLANTQFYILDGHRQPVPVGVSGELYIAGDGLSAGYLNLPELTAEKFVPNPFDASGRTRLFRTGDRVRYRDDGNVEFLGRVDHQVKLRGFRIELDEISEALRRHPRVREAVTVLRENDNRGNYLVTYVVARERNSPGYEELRNYLRTKLPNYMLPSHFVFLTALPHLPNGKVDRRALPVLECSEVSQSGEFSPPRDAVERRLVEIWEDLLGKHPIGTHDNFFDLGGHSLLVAKLLRRIRQTFSRELSMATVFQTPCIEQLASVLKDRGCSPPSTRLIPIQPEGSLPPFICLGAGSSFLPLARLVNKDQPFLGLDLGALESTELLPPYKLEDMAAQVAKAVRDFQPKGPYYLGGWCRFGVLAYEAARQILAEGEEVALLTLIDSPNPRYYSRLPMKVRIQLGVERLEYHWSNLRRSKASDMPRYMLDRFKVFRYKVGKFQARASYEFGLHTGQGRLLDLERILHLASAAYKPRPYQGRVVLFQAAERPPGQHWDLRAGWQEWIQGPLEVYDIPGGHEGMFQEPQVQVFASRMRDSLSVTS